MMVQSHQLSAFTKAGKTPPLGVGIKIPVKREGFRSLGFELWTLIKLSKSKEARDQGEDMLSRWMDDLIG
jgi:hypothetical protein